MAMKKVSGDESLDGIADKTDGIDIRVLMMIGKVEGKFVVGETADPGVAANNLADVLPSILFGLKQGVGVVIALAKVTVHQLAQRRASRFGNVDVQPDGVLHD